MDQMMSKMDTKLMPSQMRGISNDFVLINY
jgi:hypothetical protein